MAGLGEAEGSSVAVERQMGAGPVARVPPVQDTGGQLLSCMPPSSHPPLVQDTGGQ
jgi:hypothetical protein